MSIFTSITNAEHTFVAWFEKELAKVEAAAPSVETFVENGSTYAVAALKIVAAQVTPGSQAAGILTKAIQDLLTASAVAYDAGAHPTLATLFQDVVTNLGGLETATGIKNSSTVATVGKVISTIGAIASALLQLAPVAAAVA